MDNIPEYLNHIVRVMITGLPGAIAIIIGTVVLMFLVNRGFGLLIKKGKFSESEVALPRKIFGWLLTAIAFLLLIGVFGFDIGGFWTMLSTVLALIAIGFVAVWSILSNVSCTAIILLVRPFSIGDTLEFAGEAAVCGRVIDLNFLYTTLETSDGALLQIPNNLFFQRVLKRTKAAQGISLSDQIQKDEPAPSEPVA